MQSSNELYTQIHVKVLVYDSHPELASILNTAFNECSVQIISDSKKDIFELLDEHSDLGAILISEDPPYFGRDNLFLILKKIRETRPELPIYLRLSDKKCPPLSKKTKELCTDYFNLDELDQLATSVKEKFFQLFYPQPLVNTLRHVSSEALSQLFKNGSIYTDEAYLVNDQIACAEMFSLIPLDASWCRGYMMLEANQEEIRTLLESMIPDRSKEEFNFQTCNALLSEITNIIWGAVRGHEHTEEQPSSQIQIPIVANRDGDRVTFGVSQPCLCFLHSIEITLDGIVRSISLYQKFIFNLTWHPENFNHQTLQSTNFMQPGSFQIFTDR